MHGPFPTEVCVGLRSEVWDSAPLDALESSSRTDRDICVSCVEGSRVMVAEEIQDWFGESLVLIEIFLTGLGKRTCK